MAKACLKTLRFDEGRQKSLWQEVVEENIFVVCMTPMAKAITKRTLLGFENGNYNAEYIDNLVPKMKEDCGKVAKDILRKSFWHLGDGTMEFNAVIGNPPYQRTVENTSDEGLYSYFMDTAFLLSPVATLITPAKFLSNQGKTKAEWRRKVLADKHLRVVRHFDDANYCFPGHVEIKGGIAITLRNAKIEYGAIGIFTKSEKLQRIYDKVVRSNFVSICTIIHQQNKFDLASLYAVYPELKNKIGSQGKEKRLTTNIFTSSSEIFSDYPQNDSAIKVLGLIKNKRCYKFVERRFLQSSEYIGCYKVLVPASNGEGTIGESLSNPLVLGSNSGFTQSFIGFGHFTRKADAESALKYLKTKFTRTLLSLLKVTQHNHSDVWECVPLQDFTSGSDIDWTKSIPDIDRQLYRKYGLTEDEIKFIEDTIKPMS